MCVCLASQSCRTLCGPMDCSPPGFSVHGIFQARILQWVAISFSRDFPDPGMEPVSPALAGGFTEPPGNPNTRLVGSNSRLPTPVFWPGEFHGLYSPWGHKELDTTERLSLSLQLQWLEERQSLKDGGRNKGTLRIAQVKFKIYPRPTLNVNKLTFCRLFCLTCYSMWNKKFWNALRCFNSNAHGTCAHRI